MFAITGSGFRAIGSAADLEPGEYLWDVPEVPMMPGYDHHALIIDGGVVRVANAGEILAFVRARRVEELESEYQPMQDSLYTQRVIQGVALGLPSAGFAAAVRAHLLALNEAVNAAVTAVNTADLATVPTVQIQWPNITPANPEEFT